MAARAHAAYTAGKYDDALSHIYQLASASGGGSIHASRSSDEGLDSAADFRMLHNRALTEHAARGFSNPTKLEVTLHCIQTKMRRRARPGASEGDRNEEEMGRVFSAPSTAPKAARMALVGLSDGAAAAASAPAGLADLDADASVLLYNLSALQFQQKQYGAAQTVLEHLFLHIEPLDDSLAIHVCLLLLDVLCHSARGNLHTEESRRKFAAQSAAVLSFLERSHALNSSSGGGGDSGFGGGGGGDSGRQDEGGSGSADQTEFAFRLHLYKAKILLLQQQTKTSKKEIKSALEIFQRELRRGAGDAVGANSAMSGLAGTGVSQRQQQQGEHPRMFAPAPPAGVQNMAALYLKANLEYLRDNHRKALKLLASCHGFQGAEEYSGPGEAVGPPYFNNMGCLHHKLRRHHVALHYFQKALQALGREESKTAVGNGKAARGGASGDCGRDSQVAPAPICEVLYNTGLQLLVTENPEEALRCFERAALLFHNRPHLWLRMAECSIARFRLNSGNNSSRSRNAGGRKENQSGTITPSGGGSTDADEAGGGVGTGRGPLSWVAVGKGRHRRVLLPSSSNPGCGGRGDCARGDGAVGPGGGAIPPLDEEGSVEMNGSAGTAAGGTGATATGGRARGKRGRGGGCSLAHASRCLHNVLYLCAVREQKAKELSATGGGGGGTSSGEGTGFLGGQTDLLGIPPRAMSKDAMLAQQQRQQQQQAATNDANARGDDGDDDGADGGGGGGGAGVAAHDCGGEEDIRQIALVDLAYVHLGLNDPVAALSFAGRVLACKPSSARTRLAHLYAAEALCILGRPSDALEHLTPLSEETSTLSASAPAPVPASAVPAGGAPWSKFRRPAFSPSIGPTNAATASTTGGTPPGVPAGRIGVGNNGRLSLEAAVEVRASLHTNLAAVHALQGNLAQAERCARLALGISPGNAAVLRMAVYVLVKQGNIGEALQLGESIMTNKHRPHHTMERWHRGQLESVKLMSKSQAALLRRHVASMIRRRDELVKETLALVVKGTAASKSDGNDDGTRSDVKSTQELLEWQKRLDEEMKDFDASEALIEERLGGEIKFLRRECQEQAELVKNMQALKNSRDRKDDSRESKVRRMAGQSAKLLELLRDVREELAERDKHHVPKEQHEMLKEKYLRATRKIRAMSMAMGRQDGGRDAYDNDVAVSSEGESVAPVEVVDDETTVEAAAGGAATKAMVVGISDNQTKPIEIISSRRESVDGSKRLELAEAKRRLEKANKGKNAAEKKNKNLVAAMAKELAELEHTKDASITAANREIARLTSISEGKDQAVRDLVARAASVRATHGVLAADVGSQLSAMSAVVTSLVEPLKSHLHEVEGRMVEVQGRYARECRERRRLFNVVQELRGNIRVFCRCRPMNSTDDGGGICASFPREGAIEVVNKRGKKKAWDFDKVFDLDATQEAVYAEVSPLIVSVLDGYNVCIFAYGQTGTGKTHTMVGTPRDRGVNVRALLELFARSLERRGQVDDSIAISILEIYNEQIRDLLSETRVGEQRKLEVRHGDPGNKVPGLAVVKVSTLEEVLTKLAAAERHRASACTNLNEHSSRSHFVLSVTVNGVNRNTGAKSVGRLHLIDLAGSERTNKSGAAGQSLREAQYINRSLSALGDVVSARASRQTYVPYRNSTLTYLLQDSLSADSKTLMVVCVSPGMSNIEETSYALSFASRVRTVELGKEPLVSLTKVNMRELRKEAAPFRTRRNPTCHQHLPPGMDSPGAGDELGSFVPCLDDELLDVAELFQGVDPSETFEELNPPNVAEVLAMSGGTASRKGKRESESKLMDDEGSTGSLCSFVNRWEGKVVDDMDVVLAWFSRPQSVLRSGSGNLAGEMGEVGPLLQESTSPQPDAANANPQNGQFGLADWEVAFSPSLTIMLLEIWGYSADASPVFRMDGSYPYPPHLTDGM